MANFVVAAHEIRDLRLGGACAAKAANLGFSQRMKNDGALLYPRLFPTTLPDRKWVQFQAQGYPKPVCGVIYRSGDRVTNGMALGGVDTGCLDLETSGLLGYCTLFNTHVPRRGPMNLPILGMNVAGKTWVLCKPEHVKKGEGIQQNRRLERPIPNFLGPLRLKEVETPGEIHYWGHYPIVDIEFESDAPVGVGLRAWSPFLPGDVVDSMIPGIVFEVHLRNRSGRQWAGSLAFSFPGPTCDEALTTRFARGRVIGGLSGVAVRTPLASYALGVVGEAAVRVGGELGASGRAWAKIAQSLPRPAVGDAGTSVAVDFSLAPRQCKVVRFILTWCAPTWNGVGYNWANRVPKNYRGRPRTFTHMYAKYYPDPVQTAQMLARRHDSLLRRILAWQQVIYAEGKLPLWLRDSLINVLYMITEDGYWAQARPPIPRWVRRQDGLFGMNESPRECPQIECLPCSFYGSLPLAYFFPKLELSTLRGYKGYQYKDGAPPWIFGGGTGRTPFIDFAYPTRGYQWATNGISLAVLVDRFLMCHDTPDRKYLKEFYPMIKRNLLYTIRLRTTPSYSIGERIISMPDGNKGKEWFEADEPGFCGMTAHVGGLHLAQLRIVERMARRVGDVRFARQCRAWLKAAVEAMEKRLWDARGYYLNYFEPETGRKSDFVFGYQLDGEWILAHHGLPNALPEKRIRTVLATIRRCNIALSKTGAANYANPDGSPIQTKPDASPVFKPGATWDYGKFSYFPPEALMLAMTYMYQGQKKFGLELARKVWHNIVCRQGYTWDMPNIMRGDADTGEGVFGHDYYQNMMLWSLPAALEGKDLSSLVKRGGLVYRILLAAREGRFH